MIITRAGLRIAKSKELRENFIEGPFHRARLFLRVFGKRSRPCPVRPIILVLDRYGGYLTFLTGVLAALIFQRVVLGSLLKCF